MSSHQGSEARESVVGIQPAHRSSNAGDFGDSDVQSLQAMSVGVPSSSTSIAVVANPNHSSVAADETRWQWSEDDELRTRADALVPIVPPTEPALENLQNEREEDHLSADYSDDDDSPNAMSCIEEFASACCFPTLTLIEWVALCLNAALSASSAEDDD